MATTAPIVRKKRNFKALQLDVTKSSQPSPSPAPIMPPVQVQPQPLSSTGTEPVATRKPPQAGGKRRPANLTLASKKKPDLALAPQSLNVNGDESNMLTVTHTPNSAPVSGNISATRPGLHNDLTQKLANMDMNSETKLDLRNEDLKELQELGQGNGGSVKKVEHTPTGTIMAKKVGLTFYFILLTSMNKI